jgi:HAE1 family hydrophobic/amphiphilic exporter-1
MGLTRLSIQRPLTMLMIILGLVVLGYRSLTVMQVDRYPKVDFPYVSVVVVYPGAAPEDVEDQIVKPIEDAVAGVTGIDQIQSTARESLGAVVIAFVEGTDGNQAAIDVERQVASVRGNLPSDAQEPTVIKADMNAVPILDVVLSGPQGQDELFDVATNDIKPRLQAIQGVASVTVSGGREREIQVEPDPAKLAAYRIPLSNIQAALQANNLAYPVGSVDVGRQRTSVRSEGDYTTLEDIENTVVSTSAGGAQSRSGQDAGGLVYMRDIASVNEGFKDKTEILRYNGVEAVDISIVKTSDSNAIATSDSVRKVIQEMGNELPAGARMTVVTDTADFTRMSVDAVQEDLILAVLITGLVMLLFLHTIRSTFIVVLAIPTSIVSTFLVMWALGFTLNVLTLMALTLTIGILVDDSIVVLENIERHLKMGKTPRQAALDGRSEIGLAAITITLVDVVIYVPVAFTGGIVGQMFRSYGITIATTTLFSLFVSFTLAPMLASRWMRDESQPQPKPHGLGKVFHILLWPVNMFWKGFVRVWDAAFNGLARVYAATLRFFLHNWATMLLAALIAGTSLAGGGYLVLSGVVGSEFTPQEDDAQFTVSLQMPAGTNLDATDQATRQVEQLILQEVPETVVMLTNVGSGGSMFGMGGGSAINSASIKVRVVDKSKRSRSTTDIVEALRPLVKKVPEATISLVLSTSVGGGNMTSAVQVQITGPDPNRLIDLADQVEAVMRTVPGTTDVQNLDAARAPETRLVVDRQRALNLGLSPAQVAGVLRTSLTGTQVGTFKEEGRTEVDITLRMPASVRNDLEQLSDLPLGYKNGQVIRLSQVTTQRNDLAPALVKRVDRQRQLSVSSGVSGRASGDVANDVEAAIKAQVTFPTGYAAKLSGMAEAQRESFADLGSALFLSIGLIYMLLVALFQSWLNPLAIMFSLPVAVVGAFGGLLLTDNTLNIISMLGMILLVGIVTKNAILLVDFTNVLRKERGYNRRDALVEAGRLRLRPIIMTTAALVCAMLPLLLSMGAGSEIRAPLAAVVIGGNITSTVLTLILVPVVYTFFDGGSSLATRLLRRLLGREAEGGQPASEPPVPSGEPPVPSGEPPVPPAESPVPPAGELPVPPAEPPAPSRRPRRPQPQPQPQPGAAASFNPPLPQAGPDKG